MIHANLPLFIPHLGCPHDCVFCDQKKISGTARYDADMGEKILRQSADTLTRGLRSIGERRARGEEIEAEIAFFGGSFTAIEPRLMCALLDLTVAPLAAGEISGIRLSTRPDAVDDTILRLLADYRVTDIELGIQSLSDEVLSASGRGHTAAESIAAMRRVKRYGFRLVGQMMLGLPRSAAEDEISTARGLLREKIDGARVYPTAVLAGTGLERMWREGKYTPLTLPEAVERAAAVCDLLEGNRVPLLRVGLCAEDGLCRSDGVLAGGYHPALGEMVRSARMKKRMEAAFEALSPLPGGKITVTVPRGMASAAAGYQKENKLFFIRRYGLGALFIRESEALSDFEITLLQE